MLRGASATATPTLVLGESRAGGVPSGGLAGALGRRTPAGHTLEEGMTPPTGYFLSSIVSGALKFTVTCMVGDQTATLGCTAKYVDRWAIGAARRFDWM